MNSIRRLSMWKCLPDKFACEFIYVSVLHEHLLHISWCILWHNAGIGRDFVWYAIAYVVLNFSSRWTFSSKSYICMVLMRYEFAYVAPVAIAVERFSGKYCMANNNYRQYALPNEFSGLALTMHRIYINNIRTPFPNHEQIVGRMAAQSQWVDKNYCVAVDYFDWWTLGSRSHMKNGIAPVCERKCESKQICPGNWREQMAQRKEFWPWNRS